LTEPRPTLPTPTKLKNNNKQQNLHPRVDWSSKKTSSGAIFWNFEILLAFLQLQFKSSMSTLKSEKRFYHFFSRQ
jgi:hypothetical protein